LFDVITLLRAYTKLVADEPTVEQMDKFLNGVCAEDQEVPTSITEGVKRSARLCGMKLKLDSCAPYWTYMPSPNKRVPSIDGKNHPEGTHWMNQWADLHMSRYGLDFMWKFPEITKDLLGSWEPEVDVLGPGNKNRWKTDSVGAIGFIQEPGYKLRSVANPNRVYQMALKPLGDSLFGLLKTLPWDCTHDQAIAIPHIQKHLSAGKVVHCVDLSSATDYFPLALQLSALREIVMPASRDYVGAFEYLSRAPWRLKDSTIRWTKGQPLGLYPSFASFALTHGLLLHSLNGYKHEMDFFVLGDDVVILNDRLFVEYIAALKELGCPVNEAKSLNSKLSAEFAGKIVTKGEVFPQPKWRSLSDENFLDVLRLLGERALLLLRPRQRRVAKVLWDIPEFLGGVGFNPDGIPLSVRYQKYIELLEGEDRGEYLMGFDGQLNRFFNPEQPTEGVLPRPVWLGEYRTPDLDQRSLSLALKYLPTLERWYNPHPWRDNSVPGAWRGAFGANLYAVAPKGVLPQVGVGARQSLLDILERKLRP
jgi:hypothetical protein